MSSFTNFFLAISRHLKRGTIRDQFAEAVFREACKQGKINDRVFTNFQKASPAVANRIYSEHKSFPEEWRNGLRKDGYN